MSRESSLHRTVEILKLLNDGKKLCIKNLALIYDVSERTIRRDFALIKDFFGDFMSKEGDCYRAYEKVLLEDVLSATDLMTLANIVKLFGIAQQKSLVSKRTQALIDKSMSVYDFKSRPFENIRNKEIIKKLEHAIKFNKVVTLRYRRERVLTVSRFYPYKILFLNENFYLAGENASLKSPFEFRRISMIEEITHTNKTFRRRKEIIDFIKRIQTPWAEFGKEEIVVKLRIAKKVRRFFMMKKYLPSQEVVQTFANGDIEVHYRVSSLRELEEYIVKWLPHVEILAPKGLQKMLRQTLKEKLASLYR